MHDFQEQCQTVFFVMAFVQIFFKTVYDKAILLKVYKIQFLSDIGNKFLEFLLKLGIYIFD